MGKGGSDCFSLNESSFSCVYTSRDSEVKDTAVDKLGNLPKNLRLVEAIMLHKHEAPRPKGWLMAVVEAVYKEGECRQDTAGL